MGVLKMWEEILDDVGYGDVGPRLQRQALVAPPEAHPAMIVVLVSKSVNFFNLKPLQVHMQHRL